MSRKCLIIVALVWALSNFSAYGRGGTMRFAVSGGYINSLESIRGDFDGGGTQYLSGNFGGVYFGAGIHAAPFGNRNFTLSAGLDFKHLSGLLHERSVRENYVFAPVRLGYCFGLLHFGLENSLTLELYAGPAFQYGLSSKTDGYDFYNPDGQLKSSRFNILLGDGIRVALNGRYVIDAGYDFGLFPRYDLEGDGYSYRWTTSNFHVGLAYRF